MEIVPISAAYNPSTSDEKSSKADETEKSDELQRRIEQLLRRLPSNWDIMEITPPDQPLPPHPVDN